MEIEYSYPAWDDFKKLPRDVQKRIAKKMRYYAGQADPLQFAERLTNHEEGDFRFRIGRWRIFFDIKGHRLQVLRIKPRPKAYR